MSQTVAKTPKVHPSWMDVLAEPFASRGMVALRGFLSSEIAAGTKIFPPPSLMLTALERTPLTQVKVVMIGQDPYHGPGQAHGLSFSVPRGVLKPPSLRNILAELASDLGIPESRHGCLEHWADQGVLMLNSVLSVRAGQAGSHAGKGWEPFTDAVVRAVNDRPGRVAFVLWGAYAQKKASFVDKGRHLVVASVHPSPLSAHGGFFGSRPFSKVNGFLSSTGQEPIDWWLPD